MAVPASSTLIRVCPACGRRVTPPAITCRCGASVEGVALTAPPPRVLIPPPPDTTRRDRAIKIAMAIAGILVAGVIIYRSTGLASVLARIAFTNAGRSEKAAAPAPASASAARSAPTPPAATAETPADVPPAVPEPTALERVMAAAAASKRAADATAAPVAAGTLEDVISAAMPAVVRVETTTSIGSGFFITADTLLTNVHVVGTNSTVTIRRPDGKTLPGHVDTSAAELDIAVVRVSSADPKQPTLTLGSGSQARPGQEVIALGSPLGLQNTVTRGIVSAVRQIGGLTLVQTDAAINPGNSGGPLLDRSGSVIGITTLGVKSSEAHGLSFAIAIDHAKALLAGQRTLDPRGTPLTSLNAAMSGRGAEADGDAARVRATVIYEQALAAQAQRANALDEQWRAFTRICYQGTIDAAGSAHAWFAIWEPKAMQGTVRQGCTSAYADIERAANAVRDGVLAAAEAAREADVYPGRRRELLQRYRLTYPGWDR
jgi:S1-C subfamily serine protease